MIRFHLDAIEQLDVALEHLERKDKNATRFALSLIDNVAELLLVKIAKQLKHENELYDQFKQDSPHPPEHIEKSLSLYFPDKLTGLCNLEVISPEQAQTLRNLHSFRNAAHHLGETQESVLHSISAYYLQQVCKLAQSYRTRTTCLNDWLEIPFRTKRYLGELSNFPASLKDIEHSIDISILLGVYRNLENIVGSLNSNLVTDLSSDMESQIESFEESLAFLADGGLVIFNEDEIFEFLPTPTKTFSSDAEMFWCENKDVSGYQSYLKERFKLNNKKNLISSWKRKQSNLSSLIEHKALESYCRFFDEKGEFVIYREYLDKHVEDLDDWTQLQIDIMRGK